MIGSAAAPGDVLPDSARPLKPFFRICGRVLIGDFSQRQTLHADAQAGPVHHREHGAKASVLFTQQIGRGAVIVHDARRRRLDAHLLFDRPAGDGVAFSKPAIGPGQELGNDEQTDATGPRRRATDARENQMDDVFRQIVFTRGDEYLRAGDAVRSVFSWFGSRPEEPQVGAAMRLGQIHGARPIRR